MGRKKKVEEEVYHVEVITKARVSEDGDWEYLVKWADYGSDADSWEPQENVQQCDRLLNSFWKHIGTDDKDYPIGYEVGADEEWINTEKRYFKQTFSKSSKGKSHKAATQKDKQSKRQSKSNTPHVSGNSTDEYQSADERPSAMKLTRITRVVDSDPESEVDDRSREQASVASRPKTTAPHFREVPKIPDQIKGQELPSEAGSSVIAPPKITSVRTHQDQRTNPLVKSMSLSSKNVEAGSSLSTKQRIAAGIPPPRAGPKPLPPPPKSSLPSLSFKKNKPSISVNVPSKDVVAPSASVATPVTPVVPPTDDTMVVASPQPMDVDQPFDFGFTVDDAGSLGGSFEGSLATIPQKSREEIDAEKFLQSIDIPMQAQCSSSLDEQREGVVDQANHSTAELGKTQAIPKIRKKWKWSGELYITTSEAKTELLCTVSIADPSGMSNSSQINLLLSSLDSLRISRLYSVMDLSPLLRACGRPQYFGRLEPNNPSEEVAIHGLEHHLTSEKLVAAITLMLDGTEAAILVIFPGSQQKLAKVLQVPEHLLSGTPLLVVLLPFLVLSTHMAGWRSTKMVAQLPAILQDVWIPHEPSQQAMLHQATSLLCFPKTLFDFLHNSATSRAYCIWPLPDQSSLTLDTAMLQCVLKSTKAMPAKLEEDVRVVFISNEHLDVLHTMPSLVTKRTNSPEVQFWTYGYSASTTHESWQIKEVYPLGGVVTFTSSALAEDLIGCHQLMSQIIEHPLWACYLIPEVLAVTHMLCSEGSSSPSKSCLDSTLDLIDLGLISVMRTPEKGHLGQLAWLSQVFQCSSIHKHNLLETSLEALRNHPTTSGMTIEQLVAFTNNEVTNDLSNAQIQPAFMENYRRFVVIRAASENTIPFDKDSLEWSSLSLFSFKDDYFSL